VKEDQLKKGKPTTIEKCEIVCEGEPKCKGFEFDNSEDEEGNKKEICSH